MLLRDLPQFYCYCFLASKHSVSLLCCLFCLFVSRGTMHIFLNMYLWTHFSLPPLLCGHIDIYMYNVCNNACGCVHTLLLRGNTFVCAFWPCSCFLPSSQANSRFFASVLYICLYKYVQRIMCPLPLIRVQATFVKLKVAGATCFFKKFLRPSPHPIWCLLYLVEARLSRA